MDIRIILSTFFVIFLAELGDKTQFAAMAASAGSNQPASVLIGTILALSVSSIIAVAAGSLLGNYIPIKYIKVAAGVLFLVFGALYLREAFIPENEEAPAEDAAFNIVGESVLKIASVFEEREIEMLEAAVEVLKDEKHLQVINSIINDERKHLDSISKMSPHNLQFSEDDQHDLSSVRTLDEAFSCSEDEDCLLKDIYDREAAMAEFYRITAKKTNISSVQKVLNILYEEEKHHASKLARLLV